MKKSFLAVVAMMISSLVFAQVDSTSQSAPSTDYSKSGSQTDTVSTQSMPADTVGEGVGTSADSTSSSIITDEDLRSYAVIMDSVEAMKKGLLGEITTKVKSNPRITVSRYMELSKAGTDEAKLAELKATPDEIAFVKEVTEFKNQGATEISATFQALARDMVGVEKYNAIKDQLSADADLKARYDKIAAEVVKDDDKASVKK